MSLGCQVNANRHVTGCCRVEPCKPITEKPEERPQSQPFAFPCARLTSSAPKPYTLHSLADSVCPKQYRVTADGWYASIANIRVECFMISAVLIRMKVAA